MQTISIPPFQGKFEEIRIIVRKLNLQLIKEKITNVATQNSGHISIWQSMSPSYTTTQKNLVGNALFIFRNQREDFDTAIFLGGSFFIEAPKESETNRIFNKFLRYMFDWINAYVKENDIRDTTGRKFVVPHPLSQNYFESLFQE